ncbi:MAG: phosphate regulon sensor histidine kinase PhoR, partial [Nitrosopumilus sp.]|nr:phosphate regulon sensor histidine kinase PhoR [Nitrosopumilus sp.]
SFFDLGFLGATIALAIYTGLNLRQLFRLQNWLVSSDKSNIPEAGGYWGELFNEIHLMDKERRKHQQRLRKVLTRFQKAAAALPDGTVILSNENKIEWANRSANDLLGINIRNDIGHQVTNLVRHPGFIQYLEQGNFNEIISIPSPEKPNHSLVIQIIPFGSSQRLLTCRDITHIRKLEAMRSQFVANVSHELRSPITVLSGYLETLRGMQAIKPDVLHKALNNMHEQAKRMERLVVDLIALTKLETTPSAEQKTVDVAALLSSLVEAAQEISGSKQHKITLQIDSTRQLRGSQEELYSLFSNLINNAVRYSPEKTHINVRWFASNDEAVFEVEDHGPGIAAIHIPRLTERFYRVDADRSRESGGTGLGLAIVKHVLERHDGHLIIESELDKGSTFRCIFPNKRTIS